MCANEFDIDAEIALEELGDEIFAKDLIQELAPSFPESIDNPSPNGSTPADAPNIEAILDWCRRNRPDILDDIKFLIESPDSLNQRGMLMLLTVGFAAGRLYQSEHPELSVHAYHR